MSGGENARALAVVGEGEGDEGTKRAWPVVVKLRFPVEFGKNTIEEITLRRGRMGDLKGIKLSNDHIAADAVLLVMSRMSGQPLAVIEKLDADDAGELSEAVLDFFARCLATGRTG